jgi:hypothetical protein
VTFMSIDGHDDTTASDVSVSFYLVYMSMAAMACHRVLFAAQTDVYVYVRGDSGHGIAAISLQPATPSTFPPTVPSKGGPSAAPATCLSRSHSSGVWHFADQACIREISSLRAALTSLWRLREFRDLNSGETIMDVKDCPQPPVDFVLVLLLSLGETFALRGGVFWGE